MNRITFICLIFSFLFNFGASIVIRKPVKGTAFPVGVDIPVKFCPEPGITTIDTISLIAVNHPTQTIGVNIAVQPGTKCITYKFHPSQNLAVSPSTYFEIVAHGINGQVKALSATFTVGKPGFGLIITHPVTDTSIQCGHKLKIRWKGPLKLYRGLTFTKFYLSEAGVTNFLFAPPAGNLPVAITPGEKTVYVPFGLKSGSVVELLRNGKVEQYRSDNLGSVVPSNARLYENEYYLTEYDLKDAVFAITYYSFI
ncbi:11183_t:CDS:2 [Paraglomus occultum]|uniref:11183_t:CDS:1 n=1 Tax=Paraglomus occultum TaxID=144539 RepID=A0A9N8W8A7_9GLOM|nr:11183_t:CDS:2 [Paraglomus occultum]